MPKPTSDESRSDYMKRCVPMLIDEGKDKDQAVAICSSMWEQAKKELFEGVIFKQENKND